MKNNFLYHKINTQIKKFNIGYARKYKQYKQLDFNLPLYKRALIDDYIFFLNNRSSNSKSILDIGAGIGLSSYILSELNFKVESCDIGPEIKTNMNIKFNQNDLKNHSFFSRFNFKLIKNSKFSYKKKFDIIFLYAVIEHVEKKELQKFIRELDRVLKKNGEIFIFMCPRKFSYIEHLVRILYGQDKAHENLFDLNKIKNVFSPKKFTISNHKSYLALPITFYSKRNGLFNKVYLFFDYLLSKTILKPFLHFYRIKIVKN